MSSGDTTFYFLLKHFLKRNSLQTILKWEVGKLYLRVYSDKYLLNNQKEGQIFELVDNVSRILTQLWDFTKLCSVRSPCAFCLCCINCLFSSPWNKNNRRPFRHRGVKLFFEVQYLLTQVSGRNIIQNYY